MKKGGKSQTNKDEAPTAKTPLKQAISQTTACCIIPPHDVWQQIQDIREQNDKSYGKWMPHINFLFPFIPVGQFSQGAEMLRNSSEFQQIRPFRVRLTNIYYAEDSKYLWVKPEVITEETQTKVQNKSKQRKKETTIKDKLTELQAAVQRVFPHCKHTGGGEFVPHLTLGQWSKDTIKQAQQTIQEKWIPIEFEVNEISMISRNGPDDPFEVQETITLG
jgi:2'-5' RNA ligase